MGSFQLFSVAVSCLVCIRGGPESQGRGRSLNSLKQLSLPRMGLSLSRPCPCLAASAGHESAVTAPGTARLLLPALLRQGKGRKGCWRLPWSSLHLPEIPYQSQGSLYCVHSVDPALPPSLKINSGEAKLPWGDSVGDLAEELHGAGAPLEEHLRYPSPTPVPHHTIQPSLVS